MKTNIMFLLGVISVLALMPGVMANLDSCVTPEWQGAQGFYTFIDGLNATTEWIGARNATTYTIAPADLENMGATGMTLIHAVKYMDAIKNRGGAWLFYDSRVSYYYVVYQWSTSDQTLNQVYALPALSKSTLNGVELYTRGNTQTINTANDHLVTTDGSEADGVIFYYEPAGSGLNFLRPITSWKAFGNTRSAASLYFGNETDAYFLSTTSAGSVNVAVLEGRNIQSGTTYCSATGYQRYRMNGTSLYLKYSSNVYADIFYLQYEKSYYYCEDTSGNVTFYAYEGSDQCGAYGAVPDVTCSISGDSYTIPAASSSALQDNATIPTYKDVVKFADGTWEITPWKSVYLTDPDDSSVGSEASSKFYKTAVNKRALTVVPWNPYDSAWWYDVIFEGHKSSTRIRDTYAATVIRYTSPTGTTTNVPIDSVLLDTTVDLEGLPCETRFLGTVRENWDLRVIVGVNTTHYKSTLLECVSGALATNAPTYHNTTATTGISTRGGQAITQLSGQLETFEPVWRDSREDTINRVVFFELIFGDSTITRNNGDMSFNDNEMFLMLYNYTEYILSSITTNAYNYGTYFFNCQIPDGFVVMDDTDSGYITIDKPLVSHAVVLQRQIPVGMRLYLERQAAPAAGAMCVSDIGSVVVAGPDGLCQFEMLPINNNLGITVNHQGKVRQSTFPIGDYYNSNEDGEGESCASFQTDPYYVYYWDIEHEQLTLDVYVKSKATGNAISEASIYWNDEFAGITDTGGRLSFYVEWNFTQQSLKATHASYMDITRTVRIYEAPFHLEMVGGVGSTADRDAQALKGTTLTGMLDMVSAPGFMGIIVVISAMGIGIQMAGLPGIALGVLASVLMALFGMFPWSWAMVMVALAMIIGVSQFKNLVGGGR